MPKQTLSGLITGQPPKKNAFETYLDAVREVAPFVMPNFEYFDTAIRAATGDPNAVKPVVDKQQNVARAGARVTKPFLDTKADGKYIPNALVQIPALVGDVVDYFGKDRGYEAHDVLKLAQKRDKADEAAAYRINNATPATTLGGHIIEGAADMVVPSPFGKTKTAATVPGKIGNVVKELVVPLRTTSLNVAVPVGAAVGAAVGIADEVAKGIDTNPATALHADGTYNPAQSAAYNPVKQTAFAAARNPEKELDYLFGIKDQTPEQQLDQMFGLDADERSPQERTLDHMFGLDDQPPIIPATPPQVVQESVNQDQGWSLTDMALLGTAGLLTFMGGRKALGAINDTINATTKVSKSKGLIGSTPVEQFTDFKTNVTGGFFDSLAPAKTAVARAAPEAAPDVQAKLNLAREAPIRTKTRHALERGEIEGSSVNLGTVLPNLEVLVNNTDDAEKLIISNGLAARSALNTIAKAKAAGETGQPLFSQYSEDDLKNYVKVLENNPKLNEASKFIPKAFNQTLKYLVETGYLSQKSFDELTAGNPDYVHLTRALEKTGVGKSLGPTAEVPPEGDVPGFLLDRALKDKEGLDLTVDPMITLPQYIKQAIHEAETNAARREWLLAMDGKMGVKKAAAGSTADDIVTVKVNGETVKYHVPDDSMRASLEIAPGISHNKFAQTLRAINAIPAQGATGIGNPGFIFRSAGYNSLVSALTKPRGMELGPFGEFVSKMGGPTLGAADPSSLMHIPTIAGALRYYVDSAAQAGGRSLLQSLEGADSFWKYMIPDENTRKALGDRLTLAYANSYKALGNKYGVFDNHIFSAAEKMRTLSNIEDLAPGYAKHFAKAAYEDAINGKGNVFRRFAEGSNNELVKLNAGPLTKLYNTMARGLRNGASYSAVAANSHKAKGDSKKMMQLADQIRTMGGDTGQRGGHEALKTAADGIIYFDATVQPAFEALRLASKDKKQFTANALNTIATTIGGTWISALLFPEVADALMNSTDEEIARTGWVGPVPVQTDPLLRMVTGPIQALMIELSGIRDVENGGNFNPNFVRVMRKWAEDGFGFDRDTFDVAARAFDTAARMNVPNISNVPLANTLGTAAGVDMSALQTTGQIRLIDEDKADERDIFGDDRLEKTLMTIFTGGFTNFMRMIDDTYDGWEATKDFERTFDIAKGSMIDAMGRSGNPVEGAFFSDYDKVKSLSQDTQTKVYYEKLNGINKLDDAYNDLFKHPGLTSADPRTARALPSQYINPNYLNTQYGVIAIEAMKLKTTLDALDVSGNLASFQDIDTQYRDKKHFPNLTAQERNELRNQNYEKRQSIVNMANFYIRMYEDSIRARIGDNSFSFSNPKYEKYKKIPYNPAMDRTGLMPDDTQPELQMAD